MFEPATCGLRSSRTRPRMAHSDSGSSQPANGTCGSRVANAVRWVLPVALAALPFPAAALYGDRIEVFAAENVTYDSNVFRLSKSLDPRAVTGENGRSDEI